MNTICVVDKLISGALNTRRFLRPVDATINVDGERAVDTATISFPIQVDIDNGYEVKFIQDVAEMDGLKLVMNFQDAGVWETGKKLPIGTGTAVNGKLKIPDESGYNMDGYCTNTTTRYSTTDGGRALHITTTGDEVIIPDQKYFDNSTNAVGSTSIIDFSGMFDIFIRFRCGDTTNITKYLFDKADGTNGLQIYISNGATGVIKVDATVGGIISNITGVIQVNDNVNHIIRVKRGSDSIIRLYVDTVTDGTVSTSSNYTNSTASLNLGNNFALNRPALQSFLSQVRVYCNAVLDDINADLLWKARRQYNTMKFGGVVWNKVDGTDKKTVQIRSYGDILNKTVIQPQNFTNTYTSQTDQIILSDIVTNYLTDWSIAFADVSAPITYPIYIANGVLIVLFQFFLIPLNATFHTDARKTITVETNDLDFSMAHLIQFTNGIYDITLDTIDKTGTTNYAEVIGTSTLTATSQTFTAGSTGVNTFTLSHNPVLVVVTDNGTLVAANALTINYNAGTVAFSTTIGHTIVISYSYNNNTTGVANYTVFSDSTSITKNGFLGKRIILNGISDQSSINGFGSNYMSKYKDVNQRISILSPFPVPFSRVNLKVSVTNTIKGISAVTKTIKAYTYNYPDMTMNISVGSFLYDSYDLDNAYATAITNSNTAYINTNTV